MSNTILKRTANSLSENCHNIGEAPNAIYRDALLLENDPGNVSCAYILDAIPTQSVVYSSG
jgi:hypothetical protein